MRDDEFTLIEDVVGQGDPSDHHHLVDYQTQELVSRLWSKYLADCRQGNAPTAAGPIMRKVSYTMDNEAFAGSKMQRGIKCVSRTRRGCTFVGGLWHADDGRMVHSSEIVTVWVEPGKGAVEIPADFWANVEKLEGRTIAITER